MDHTERHVIAQAVAALEPVVKDLKDRLDGARNNHRSLLKVRHPGSVKVQLAREAAEELAREHVKTADVLVQLQGLIEPATVAEAFNHVREVMPEPEPPLTRDLRDLLAKMEAHRVGASTAQPPAGRVVPAPTLATEGR